jgi:hypothetical protein
MPYITREERQEVNKQHVGMACIKTPGQLNYAITMLIEGYLVMQERVGYTEMNAAYGAAACAAQEFYRRKMIPYEQQKQYENGDLPIYAHLQTG